MKSKKQIEACILKSIGGFHETGHVQSQDLNSLNSNLLLILEVLLDTRELLQEIRDFGKEEK